MTQLPLSRYIEKLILARSGPFSQILSHMLKFSILNDCYIIGNILCVV